MAESKMKGGQPIIVGIVIVGFIALTMWTLSLDRRSDRDLLNKVQTALMTEYFPDEIDNIKKAGYYGVSAGSINLKIKEINESYPIYVRSNHYRTGVLKINFTLTDSNKIIKDGISFYRFAYSPIMGKWTIRGKTTKFNYFMKIIF